ncbi:OmpA family protein [Winogradskyella sp. E313]|uniref:OmpA family protein n=2 Tax=Winogradskyella immobilis TaxID=2816852 RepID=A0ABS8EIL1_9FLAO|nr:OmpA family protein [Winogradskyella immobilis]
MKTYIHLFACMLFVFNFSTAQTEKLKRADKFFEMKAYVKAAELYEAKEPNQKVLQNLGDSYYYNSNMQNAIKTYRELILTYKDSIDIEYYFRYAQALKGVKNYKLADEYLSQYFNKRINTQSFIDANKKATPHTFKINELNDGSTSNDFGLTFFGDNQVAFASTRNTENPAFAWNDQPYLDLYSATINSSGKLENITPFSDAINTDSHESNPVLSADGKTMYFNRTNTSKSKSKTDEEERIAHIKIYKAELVGDQWANIEALPFTSNKYSTEHPSLSKDGKTLYFASDMPGGLGGFDIYKVAINDDGTYGEPENLGSNINTKHREQFPYVSDKDVLYYSSNGHYIGYGGLDVYRSNNVNGVYDAPVNLGDGINSNLDDFAFVIDEKNDKGYFSSNRAGNDRLYTYDREENILTKYLVDGVVQDKNSKAILPGAKVILLDDSGNIIQEQTVDDNAKYLFKLEPNKKYIVRGTLKAYIPQDVEFSTDSQGKISHNIYLSLESFADAEERVNKDKEGVVKVELDKIYFDFDKSKIREDAAKTLDVLVDLMKKYPSMSIEVSAHTDVRGRDQYNLDLSKKRAASTLEYLVSRGIERSRLTSEGYGETKPLNHCDKPGICSKADYEVNRRCEFKVIN